MKKNNKGIVYFTVIVLCIFLFVLIYCIINDNHKMSNDINEENNSNIEEQDEDVVEASIKPFDEEKAIILNINGFNYGMILENNLSAYDLFSVLPLELNMDDLNNNEKYAYLSFSLSQEDNYTGHISKGDVMLYQSNCLVIFYDDFDTNNLYTKIGHIDNLQDLGNGSIKVIIQ